MAGLAAILAIVLTDRWLAASERTLVQQGVADEIAHLLTAGLLLAAVPTSLPARFVAGALVGSVAIDLDHLPLVAGFDFLTRETNRPFSHGLLSVAAAVGLALLLPVDRQRMLLGAAAGFGAHFWRDLATSTAGVPLLWPLQTTAFQFPYSVYLGSLFACVILAALSRFPSGAMRQRGRGADGKPNGPG